MLRPWNFHIHFSRTSAIPLATQLMHALIGRIQSGVLIPGAPLPSSRELALQLGVNRKTVVRVYDELVAQGWLTTEGRRGTFVSPRLSMLGLKQRAARTKKHYSGKIASPNYKTYGTDKELPVQADKQYIEFTDGVPDTRIAPFGAISRAFRLALIDLARGGKLGYGDPRGLSLLRNNIAIMLRSERGLSVDEDSICVVRGSQMGIYATARILVQHGDIVAMEQLTYPSAREAFKSYGARIINVMQDEYGMIPESLEKVCRTNQIRAIYVTPQHQFPTTVTMPISRRMQILALAEQYGFVIVEDDYDHEFHYAHNPLPPIASFGWFERTIYIGSMSKILAPGLRIGYVVAPPRVINQIANEILLIDRQGNGITERAVAELMLNGQLKNHVQRALGIYKSRMDFSISMIQEKLHRWASVSPPDGGLALWLQLSSNIDMQRFQRATLSEKIIVASSDQYSDGALVPNAIRIGFGNLDEEALRLGFQRLERTFSLFG